MASVEELEERVARLEVQVRHMTPPEVAAVGFAVGLVHDDTQAIRAAVDGHTATLDGHTATLGRLDERLDRQDSRLDNHGEMLREILRRLPGQE